MAAVDASTTAVAKSLRGPRACTTCAKAKSRCVPGPKGQDKCERCHRLRKPCSSQTPAPPRKRKEPKPTRVAELERRLEDLTARIEAAQRLAPAVPSPPRSPDSPQAPEDARAPIASSGTRTLSGSVNPIPAFSQNRWSGPYGHLFPKKSIFDTQGEEPSQQQVPSGIEVAADLGVPALATDTTAPPALRPAPPAMGIAGASYQQPLSQPSLQQPESLWPQGDEAESLLAEYKTHMGHLNPFAIVPPRMTSAQLREQKPFLWKAIMMLSCLYDGPRQVALGNELLREVSEAAFTKPQKSLDLLQGLQIFISWYHYNLNKFQMTNLLFLARSITASLGFAEAGAPPDKGGYTSEALEQMRAFAGTYYVVTITFTTNKKPDGLMNSSYLATCCRALHNQMEYPTDELLVHLVRAQQLSQSISQAFARRNAMPSENQAPKAAFIQGLLDRIRGFAANLPPHIRVNPNMVGHLHVAELILYEHSLPELAWCPFAALFGGQHPVPPPAAESLDPDRLELLWACVRVTREYMAHRFAHESGDYPRFNCMSSFDLTYMFLTMLRLVTLQVPGWDLAKVKEESGFDDFATRLADHMQHTAERRNGRKAGVAGGSTGSPGTDNGQHIGREGQDYEDTFAKVARKIRSVKDQIMLGTGFNSVLVTGNSQPAGTSGCDCDTVPMTLADATQDLMKDMGGGLWQDVMSSMNDWNAFVFGEPVDWSTVFANYDMAEPIYAQ